MRFYTYTLAAILCLLSLMACQEKIELSDDGASGSGIQLKITSLDAANYQLTWTKANTVRFVKYVLLASDNPIPDSINVSAPTNGVLIALQTASTDSIEHFIHLDFSAQLNRYYRVALVLTDRTIMSNEQQIKTNTHRSFPFRYSQILVNQDRTQMYAFSLITDSIYLIDLATLDVIGTRSHTAALVNWCVGKRNGVQELYIKTTDKLLRFSGNHLEPTLEADNTMTYNQLLFMDHVLIALRSPFFNMRILSTETGLQVVNYDIPFSVPTPNSHQIFRLNKDDDTFALTTIGLAATFRVAADGQVTFLKKKDYAATQFFQLTPEYMEIESPAFLPINADKFIDSALTQMQQYTIGTPMPFQVQVLPAYNSEHYVMIQSDFISSAELANIFLRDYATQSDIITPIKLEAVGLPTTFQIFDAGQRIYWIRNSTSIQSSCSISSVPI